jgi:hypothetical protein
MLSNAGPVSGLSGNHGSNFPEPVCGLLPDCRQTARNRSVADFPEARLWDQILSFPPTQATEQVPKFCPKAALLIVQNLRDGFGALDGELTAMPRPWPSARPIGPSCNASCKGLPIKRSPFNK